MKQIIISYFLLAGICFTACTQTNVSTYNGKKWEQLQGSGQLITSNPVVGAFNSIEVNDVNAKIRIETGAADYSMNISIDDNLKDFFKWKLEEGTLKLTFDLSGGKYSRWLSDNNTVITIKAPAVEKLVNTGNSELEINLQNQDGFNLLSDGNPDITLNGKIAALNVQLTGNPEINASELVAEKIILSTNGNADVKVKTKALIEKEIKGNNDIVNLFYNSTNEKPFEGNGIEKIKMSMVRFKLKNNSILPVKITLISYRPDEPGNGTTGFLLASYGSKAFTFPEGTKIYLADNEQVNTVMSGAKISDQQPFLIVKKEDAGKTFKIN
jgi:hypothetical protein